MLLDFRYSGNWKAARQLIEDGDIRSEPTVVGIRILSLDGKKTEPVTIDDRAISMALCSASTVPREISQERTWAFSRFAARFNLHMTAIIAYGVLHETRIFPLQVDSDGIEEALGCKASFQIQRS